MAAVVSNLQISAFVWRSQAQSILIVRFDICELSLMKRINVLIHCRSSGSGFSRWLDTHATSVQNGLFCLPQLNSNCVSSIFRMFMLTPTPYLELSKNTFQFRECGAVFVINPHTIQWQILSWAHNSSFFELIPRFFSMLTILLLPSF